MKLLLQMFKKVHNTPLGVIAKLVLIIITCLGERFGINCSSP